MDEQAQAAKPFPWLWIAGGIVLLGLLTGGGVVVAGVLTDAERKRKIVELAKARNIPAAVALAIFRIESGGKAFGKDGRMIIRYEPHIFAKYSPTRVEATRGGQAAEWDNFARASAVDPHAAKLSISMGAAQVMGFNFKMVGFPTVEAMFDALSKSEDAQIVSFFDFVKNRGIEEAARKGDWTTFARAYNGAGQQGYDTMISSNYAKFVKEGYEGIG
jgi:hypothetical protein